MRFESSDTGPPYREKPKHAYKIDQRRWRDEIRKKKEQFDLGQNIFYLFINSPVASRLRNTNLLPYSMRRTFYSQ